MACSKCRKNIPTEAFATFRTRKGEVRRRGICKDCRGKYAIENFNKLQIWRKNYNVNNKTKKRIHDFKRRMQIKVIIDKIKESTPCKDCGRFLPSVAMDFDHIKGKNKSIARMVSGAYRIELILEEIKLCDVVCACCHRIRTTKRRDNLFIPGLSPKRLLIGKGN